MSRSLKNRIYEARDILSVEPNYRTRLNQMGGMQRFVELGNGRFTATRYYQEGRKATFTIYPIDKTTIAVHLVSRGVSDRRAMRDFKRALVAQSIGDSRRYPNLQLPEEQEISAFVVVPPDFQDRIMSGCLSGYFLDIPVYADGTYSYTQNLGHPHKINGRRPVNVTVDRRIEATDGSGQWVGEIRARAEKPGDETIAIDNFVERLGAKVITPETFDRLIKGVKQ